MPKRISGAWLRLRKPLIVPRRRPALGSRRLAPGKVESLEPNAESLSEFVHVRGQQLAEAAELRQVVEVVAEVAERPRDVLDVDRVAARRGLVAERAEGL